MKGLVLLAILSVVLLLGSCGGGAGEHSAESSYGLRGFSQESKTESISTLSEEDDLIPDEIIIKVKEGEDPRIVAQSIIENIGGSIVDVSGPYALIKLEAGVSAQSAISTARANPKVEIVSQNRRIRIPRPIRENRESNFVRGLLGTLRETLFGPLSLSPNPRIPNDQLFNQLWGMHKILAPQGWNTNTGSNQVIVAVLDTGVDYNHPDLQGNMWRNLGEICENNNDDDNNGYIDDCYGFDTFNNDGDPMDDNGHGTHVAGTIGAVANNSIGVAGVNWQVKILACKLGGPQGPTIFGEIRCINYLIALKQRGENIAVVNASYGYMASSPDPQERDAIIRLRNNGILFVAAAGNESHNNDSPVRAYPCSFSTELDNVICVASTGRDNLLSEFSNYGFNTVQVAAPGSGILSTVPNQQYGGLSGTSMAAPHVTGLAALIKAANPNFSYLDIKQRILSTVDVSPSLQGKVFTGGKINVYRALGGTNPVLLANPIGRGGLSGSGITCGNVCAGAYATGSLVNLTASPQQGAQQLDWGGDCSVCGRNSSCNITMDITKNCFVTFYTPPNIPAQGNLPAEGNIDDGGSATVGVQSHTRATQYRYNTSDIRSGLALDFIYQGQDYTVNTTAFRYRHTSSPNLINFPSIDDAFTNINTPFPISFYGNSHSQVYVSTNGVISFGAGTNTFQNTNLPNSNMPPMIAAFWDDLYIDPYSRVYWHVEGTTPNRVFVITYENVRHYRLTPPSPSIEDGITFQVIFYENDPNRITLQYADTRFFGTVVAVSKFGTGSGTVSASTGNINCGNVCADHYGFYAKVILTANASQGSSFSGWSGDCSACGNNTSCDVEVNKSKFCLAQFNQVQSYTLTVNRQGNGSGTVTSNPQGINCGQTCSASFPANTQVTLTATPAQGSVFAGWGGDCANCGTNTQCPITMNASRTCTATFNTAPPPTFTVTVNSTGNGSGSISSNPAGINYSYPSTNTGSASFNQGSTVVITATANTGSTVSWNGTCQQAGGTEEVVNPTQVRCTFTNLNSDKTITATFSPAPPVTYTLTVNRQGTGSGTVTSNPQGINCGQTCSASFPANTQVTLTATPAQGSVFAGWGGDCANCGTNTQCPITMNASRTCTATFNVAGGGGGGGGGGAPIIVPPPQQPPAQPPTDTGSTPSPAGGQIEVTVVGGTFTARPTTVTNIPAPPQGGTAPHGAVTFTVQLAQAQNSITVRVTFPNIPQGARFFKLVGSQYIDITNQVQVSGNTIIFTVTDNSNLDANPQSGVIGDPVVLVVPQQQGGQQPPAQQGGGGGGCSMGSGASPVNGLLWLLLPLLMLVRRVRRAL